MSTDVKPACCIDARFPDCCTQCDRDRPNDSYVVRADKADFTLGTLLTL